MLGESNRANEEGDASCELSEAAASTAEAEAGTTIVAGMEDGRRLGVGVRDGDKLGVDVGAFGVGLGGGWGVKVGGIGVAVGGKKFAVLRVHETGDCQTPPSETRARQLLLPGFSILEVPKLTESTWAEGEELS